jgi:uncharacterized membrane protein
MILASGNAQANYSGDWTSGKQVQPMNGSGQYMQMQPVMQPPMQQNYQQVQVAENAADFVCKSSFVNLTKHRFFLTNHHRKFEQYAL